MGDERPIYYKVYDNKAAPTATEWRRFILFVNLLKLSQFLSGELQTAPAAHAVVARMHIHGAQDSDLRSTVTENRLV